MRPWLVLELGFSYVSVRSIEFSDNPLSEGSVYIQNDGFMSVIFKY